MLKTKHRNNIQKNEGFSLVELIVAVGMFGMLTVVVSSLVVVVLNANIRTRAYSVSLDNVNIIMENLIRGVREGSQYHCGDDSVVGFGEPQDCPSGGSTYFAYEEAGGDPNSDADQIVLRQTFVAGSRAVIQKSTDGGATFSPLFSVEDVAFDKMLFFVSGSEDPNEVPRTMIVLGGEVRPGTKDALEFSVQTTVSERFSPTIEKGSEQEPVPPPYPDNSDNTPPTIAFVFPTNNDKVDGGPDISLVATADDPGGVGVKVVEFFDPSGVLIGSDNAAPYTTKWNTLSYPDGQHYIKAVARDFNGIPSDRDNANIGQIRILLKNPVDKNEPTLTIIRPKSGDNVFNDDQQWYMEVFADDDTAIRQVEYFLNDNSLGDQTGDTNGIYTRQVVPGSISNDRVPCDQASNRCTHTFRAEAEDTVGKTVSAETTFYIVDTKNPVLTQPTFSNYGKVEEGDKLRITSDISDPFGGSGIRSVDFYYERIDPCPISTWFGTYNCTGPENMGQVDRNGSIYSLSWEAPPVRWGYGSYSYRVWARAVDEVGNIGVSNDLIIKVYND